jgi:long-chain acyl-CoA synthetase
VVIGSERPYLVALVRLNDGTPPGHGEGGAAVLDAVTRDFQDLSRQLARHEQVRAVAILSAPLTMESGELTASMKLRRDRIEARRSRVIDALYRADSTEPPAETGGPRVILEDPAHER